MNKKTIVQCAQCSKDVEKYLSKMKSKSGLYFCNRKCKEKAQKLGGIKAIQPPHYKGEGRHNYRARALDFYGRICAKCEYANNEKMLDVHHTNGNRNNNKIENLEVLCVWCHACETRDVKPHRLPGRVY